MGPFKMVNGTGEDAKDKFLCVDWSVCDDKPARIEPMLGPYYGKIFKTPQYPHCTAPQWKGQQYARCSHAGQCDIDGG